MKEYKKILVPVDGSKTAEAALSEIEKIVEAFGSRIYLLRVVNPLAVPYFAYMNEREFEMELTDDAEKYLAKLLDRLEKKGIAVESSVQFGNEAHEILTYATKNKVDLIAMSSHGHSMVERWLLGSVAEKVLHHATQPVLLVRVPFTRIKQK